MWGGLERFQTLKEAKLSRGVVKRGRLDTAFASKTENLSKARRLVGA